MTDWRFDESDDAEFDKGFERFIQERKIKTFKKGDPPSEDEISIKLIEFED